MVAPTTPTTALSSSLLLLLALVLAAFVSTGEALECYVCSSVFIKNCEDSFNAESVPKIECTPEAVEKAVSDATKVLSDVLSKYGVDVPRGTKELEFVCQKMKRKNKDGEQVVLRSCAFSPDAMNSCPPKNADTDCVQCNSNLCNGAPVGPLASGARLLLLLLLPAATLRLLRP